MLCMQVHLLMPNYTPRGHILLMKITILGIGEMTVSKVLAVSAQGSERDSQSTY